MLAGQQSKLPYPRCVDQPCPTGQRHQYTRHHPVTSAGIVLANFSCGERASSQGIGNGRLSSTRRLSRAAVKPGCARRSTAPPNAKRSSQPIAPPCVGIRCAGPDAVAADARKNRTGTPRGEGLTTRSRKRLVGRKVTFLTICNRGRLATLPRRSVSS